MVFKKKKEEKDMDRNLAKYDLTEGNAWVKILNFAFPILFGIIFQQLYTTIDAIIVGQYAGTGAIAAIESVYTITKLPVNFFAGFATGATIVISKYFGAKQLNQLSEIIHTSILFSFIGSIVLSFICIILSPIIISLINVPYAIYQPALWYVTIYFSGMGASMTYNICSGIFRSTGDSRTPLYCLLVANILNIILDIVFVAILKWGVVGAGIATLISQVCSSILVLIALTRTSLPCKIYLRKIKLYKEHVVDIIKLGFPIGIQSIIYPLANTVIQTSINTFGINAIAAWAVSGKLDFLVWHIADTFGTTASTFVAQNHGAEKYERAKKGVYISAIISFSLTGVIGTILLNWSGQLGNLLVQDVIVLDLVAKIMHLIAPLYVLYTLGSVFSGAIRGSGETVKPMIISVLGSCVCRVLWIWLIVPKYQTFMTVLMCYPLSWGITMIGFIICFRFRFNSNKTNICN